VNELLKKHNFVIENIDSTVVLEAPKIAPFVSEMQKNISDALAIKQNQVSIKATTNEGMGFIGVSEGAVAYAVTIIVSEN
jgi:2-C-methyl-D-erythritol 2,4-cyclodiphosphate synthase